MKKVRKAVIPAAGFGTRVLPATKALPKEMLTIVDKPSLQYIVEELVQAGITDILIITGRNKNSIEDHFDYSFELEETLKSKAKYDLLDKVQHISSMANIYYVRQKHPKGLGHAILKAKNFVGDDPFVIALGDDIVYSDKLNATEQLIKVYEQYGKSILGCQEVQKKDVSKYGIVSPIKDLGHNTFEINNFVEKPDEDLAPSNMACLGRYILSPKIFNYLEKTPIGKSGEIQLTDGILLMLRDGETILAHNFYGKRYDIGNKIGLLVANIEFGLRNEETKDDLEQYLKCLKTN